MKGRAKSGGPYRVGRMSEEKGRDEELLRAIIGGFTSHPETLRVKTETRGQSSIISFWAHRSDHPKIIGGQGKHLQAIRTIFLYIAKREGRQVTLLPNEPTHGEGEGFPVFEKRADWQPDSAIALMRRVLDRILRQPYKITPVSNEEQTILEITVEKQEQSIIDGLKPYLHTLWHAIGKNEGRKVYVDAPAQVPEALKP